MCLSRRACKCPRVCVRASAFMRSCMHDHLMSTVSICFGVVSAAAAAAASASNRRGESVHHLLELICQALRSCARAVSAHSSAMLEDCDTMGRGDYTAQRARARSRAKESGRECTGWGARETERKEEEGEEKEGRM